MAGVIDVDGDLDFRLDLEDDFDSGLALALAMGGAAGRAAALQAIQRIQISGTAESLPRVLERILPWTQQSSHLRREIYILTDLTAGAWPAEAAANLKTRLAEFPDVQLYVIDLGVAQPHNAGLGTLRLSAESLPRSGELELQSEVTSWGISGTRTVELLVEEADPTRPVLQDGRVLVPRAVPRGRQLVELSSGGSQAVQLVARLVARNSTG